MGQNRKKNKQTAKELMDREAVLKRKEEYVEAVKRATDAKVSYEESVKEVKRKKKLLEEKEAAKKIAKENADKALAELKEAEGEVQEAKEGLEQAEKDKAEKEENAELEAIKSKELTEEMQKMDEAAAKDKQVENKGKDSKKGAAADEDQVEEGDGDFEIVSSEVLTQVGSADVQVAVAGPAAGDEVTPSGANAGFFGGWVF